MENKNIHAGHRSRFRKQVEQTGIYNLSDIHFLEYLLTFTIPRADTNPIAHRLLSEFKSIDSIFEASPDALCRIDGIGEKTARFLQMMSSVCFMYNKSKASTRPYAGNLCSAISFIKNILPPSKNEQFVILILGKNCEVKNYKIFDGISHSYINFDSKALSEYLISHKASFCIMAHTHPEHSSMPSNSDLETFDNISPLLNSLSITLIDNLILGEKDFFTQKHNIIRDYDQIMTSPLGTHLYSLKSITTKNLQI